MRRRASLLTSVANVTQFQPGDRVIVFHHIPCGTCFYCQRKLYAQCPVYKKVGVTAGFEPAGGGFSQYVRVMDWIVERGVEKIPDGVPFEVAAFVEPLNTCLKAVDQCDPQPDDVVLVQGQGPIGLLFTMLLKLRGCTILATDTIPQPPRALEAMRRDVRDRSADGRCFGEAEGTHRRPRRRYGLRRDQCERPRRRSCSVARVPARKSCCSRRPRIKNASNSPAPASAWANGRCSAPTALRSTFRKKSADLVFSGKLPLHLLISHRVPLDKIEFAFRLATHPGEFPGENPLKIIVRPQELSSCI